MLFRVLIIRYSKLCRFTYFGKHRCKNGTQELKCARRFTQLGISWPHKICEKTFPESVLRNEEPSNNFH